MPVRPQNSPRVLLSFLPLALSPPSLKPPTPGQLFRLPGATGFKHLQGSEPLLWSLAAPASSASPGAQADPHRARRLIRTARRWFAAAETAAPATRPPLAVHAGWCSLSLSAAAATGSSAAAGAPTPECPLSAREDSNGEPSKRARCRPPPIPPRWIVFGATGKVRVFSLFQ